MARRRPLHRYPEGYYAFFADAQTDDVTLEFDTPQKAINFRIELYNLRFQVRDHVRHDPTNAELAQHYLLMENIELCVVENTLVLRKKEPKALDELRRRTNG